MRIKCVILGMVMGIVLCSVVSFCDFYYNIWEELYKEIEET